MAAVKHEAVIGVLLHLTLLHLWLFVHVLEWVNFCGCNIARRAASIAFFMLWRFSSFNLYIPRYASKVSTELLMHHSSFLGS